MLMGLMLDVSDEPLRTGVITVRPVKIAHNHIQALENLKVNSMI